MRDSNAAGALRATERLRHPHDHKPRAAARPTRTALANGARTLGAVLAAGAGTLALGLTAAKLGSAAKGLYGRQQSKRASEARSRELRVIVVTPKNASSHLRAAHQ
jgi:predicted RNA methylase